MKKLLLGFGVLLLVGCECDGNKANTSQVINDGKIGANEYTNAGRAGVRYKYGNGTEVSIGAEGIHGIITWKITTEETPVYRVDYLSNGTKHTAEFNEFLLTPWVKPSEPTKAELIKKLKLDLFKLEGIEDIVHDEPEIEEDIYDTDY